MDVHLIEVQDPDGNWMDITDHVDLEGFGAINLGVEDDLLQFRTGDITLSLENDGDAVRALFAGADPTRTWRIRFQRNGVKFFEGVISIRAALRFNENERSAELTAFGYLSLIDGISAETVKRTFATLTASGTAGSAILTLSPNVDLLTQDDRLRIASATVSEEVEVSEVASGTTVRLKASLANTWPAGSSVEILTPFYRRKTPTFLVEALFAAAGIPSPTIDLTGTDFLVPVATPMNTEGLPITGVLPDSAIAKAGRLRIRFQSGDEYEAANASDGAFVNANATIIGELAETLALTDWQVYKATEPGTLVAMAETASIGGDRWGGQGVDFDHAPPRKYVIKISTNTVPNPDQHTVTIARTDWDGANKRFAERLVSPTDINTIETAATNNSQTGVALRCEYDDAHDFAWFAYGLNHPTNGGRFGYYDIAGATRVDLETSGAGSASASMGELRYSQAADLLLRLKPDGVTMQGYRGATLMFEETVPSGLVVRSLRYMTATSRWVGILQQLDRTRLFICDQDFRNQVELEFSNTASAATATSPPIDTSNWLAHFGNQLVGRVDGQYVVIDTPFSGVVVYADWTGKSIAGALADIAKLVNCVAFVDSDFNGFFIGRTSQILTNDPPGPKVLDELVNDDSSDQVWEQWFGQVRVVAGDTEVTYGDESDGGRPLDVEADLVPNISVAAALALAYVQFYSRPRRERRVTVADDDTLYLPLQRVRIGADEWTVYEIDQDLPNREVGLRLVEAL